MDWNIFLSVICTAIAFVGVLDTVYHIYHMTCLLYRYPSPRDS